MGKDGSARPGDGEAMAADELVAIGERLYGRHGWMTRLASAIGKDVSTIRRWKTGARIERAEVLAIREVVRKAEAPETTLASPDRGLDPSVLQRVLKVIAAAQAAARQGVGVSVMDTPWGLQLLVEVDGRVLTAIQRDGYAGLETIEQALSDMVPAPRA